MDETDDDLVHDLLYATVSRDVEKVDELMQYGIDPCTPTKDGTSPIHKAALLESPSGPKIISKMLSYGADPNATTPTGLSPLHIAAMWGRVETLDVLLDGGADPSLKDIDDMSALDYTDEADENKDECIDALTRFRPSVKRKYSDSPHGYAGDISENYRSDSGSESSYDCFWSPPSTPIRRLSRNSLSTPKRLSVNSLNALNHVLRNSPSTPNRSSRNSPCAENRSIKNSPCTSKTSSRNSSLSRRKNINGSPHSCCSKEPKIKCILSPKKNNSSLFVPISPNGLSKNCDLHLKISVVNGCNPDDGEKSPDSAFENDFDSNSADNDNEQIIENLSNILRLEDVDNCLETYINFDAQNNTFNIDGEPTVDYSHKSNSVVVDGVDTPIKEAIIVKNDFTPKRLEHGLNSTNNDGSNKSNSKFLDLSSVSQKDVETIVKDIASPKHKLNSPNLIADDNCSHAIAKNLSSPKKEVNDIDKCNRNTPKKLPMPKNVEDIPKVINKENNSHNVALNISLPKPDLKVFVSNSIDDFDHTLLDPDLLPKQKGVIEELAEVNVEYDWKDISDIGTASEFEESFIVPGSILSLSDDELRARLKKVGETPGPISDTTRKLYQKHLTRLEKNNYRPLKFNDKYKDYTPEMRLILNGSIQLSKDHGELLEAEMALQFTRPEKHTWREGSMKTSFNYLLLDPRVTNNLPERAKNMTYVEQLRVFMASVFYIGKGKKSRPYEHFYEAIKLEKNVNSPRPPSCKRKMIYDIWASELGVVSLHVFHSVIPVEAYTREACMIEALGLTRLTNAKSGDFYGNAASWGGKKRRQLGIYILSKAMEIFILEGERQIRQIDLVK